jgi:hypothetical protein
MIERIKQIINEELGILLEVSEESKRVYKLIINDLYNRTIQESDVCIIKNGEVNATLNNIQFKVSYTYRNFNDKSIVETIGEDALTEGGSGYISNSFIFCNVNILAISGTVNRQLALSTIQHELEHIYQQIKTQKRIPGNDMRYALMRTDMESNDKLRQQIGRLVYACYKSEQEGFINGTYAWCMADDIKTEPYNYDTILNSPSGKLLVELTSIFDIVKKNNQMRDILTTEYNLSLRDIEHSINDFKRKIGRLLIKVNKDKSKFWRI